MTLPSLKILKNLNLSRQVSLLLGVVFVCGLALAAPSVATLMNAQAQNQVSLQAETLLETTSAVGDYTDTQIRPHLEKDDSDVFLPQSVPFYSAREVFEKFRDKDPAWSDYFYKDATLNPTNPRDKADIFETDLVYRFRKDTNIKKMSGFRTVDSQKLFYIAQPLAITESSCLECHSTPEAAPKSMVEKYGRNNGFGWELNEIVAARIVYVPASMVLQAAEGSFIKVMSIIVVIFAIVIFAVNWWLRRNIVRPLKRMSQVAEAVSKGHTEAEFDRNSQDEVGKLAKAFNLMKISLEISIKKLEEFSTKLRRLES